MDFLFVWLVFRQYEILCFWCQTNITANNTCQYLVNCFTCNVTCHCGLNGIASEKRNTKINYASDVIHAIKYKTFYKMTAINGYKLCEEDNGRSVQIYFIIWLFIHHAYFKIKFDTSSVVVVAINEKGRMYSRTRNTRSNWSVCERSLTQSRRRPFRISTFYCLNWKERAVTHHHICGDIQIYKYPHVNIKWMCACLLV